MSTRLVAKKNIDLKLNYSTSNQCTFERVQIGIELSSTRHEQALSIWQRLLHDLEEESSSMNNFQGISHWPSGINQARKSMHLLKPHQVQFQNQDMLHANITNATHVYLSSLCLPSIVLLDIQMILLDNFITYGRLQAVVSLNDLQLFENVNTTERGKDYHNQSKVEWKKEIHFVQMSWGSAQIRIYCPII